MKENLNNGIIIKFETGETECYTTEKELFDSCFYKNTRRMEEIKILDIQSFYNFYNIILRQLERLNGKYDLAEIFSRLKVIDCDISIVKIEENKINRIVTDWPITEFIISDINTENQVRKEIKNQLFNTIYSGKKNNLQKINISDSVMELGDKFFYKCDNLKEVKLPSHLNYISKSMFSGCKSLKEINIPSSVVEIKEYAFEECNSLENIVIPESVSKINDATFACCYSLKEINIPSSVVEIKKYAFYGCSSLKEIVIPNSINKIGENAFEFCRSLKKIIFPSNLNYLDKRICSECQCLEETIIPESVVEIKESAFSGCKSLKKIIIPDSVTEIGELAFFNCQSLEYIKLSKNIKNIGHTYAAFSNCESLQEIEIDLENVPNFTEILVKINRDIEKSEIAYPSLTINYSSLETLINNENSLYETIRKLNSSITSKWLKKIGNLSKLKKFKSITFVGPQISSMNKNTLTSTMKKFGINDCNFETKGVEENDVNLKNEQSINTNNNNDDIFDIEILNLLKKVDEIIINLPEDSKKNILEVKNKMIEKYKKEREQEKPKLDIHSNRKDIFSKNVGDAKITINIELNNLLFMLSQKEKVLQSLTVLNQYQELLKIKVDKLNDVPNNIEQLLQNLIYISSKIDTSKKEEILKKINQLLRTAEQKYQVQLNIDINFENVIKLSFDSNLDPMLEFYQELRKFYDEEILYYNSILPFLELFNALNSRTEKDDEYTENNSITSIIYNTNYLIDRLQNQGNKQELVEKFEVIKNKYSKTIGQVIEREELSKEKYQAIVLELRKEIQDVLCNLSIIATKEQVQDKELKDFEDALEFIEKYDFVSEKIANNTIEIFAIDIFECLKSSFFNEEEKEEIKQKMHNIVRNGISMLKESLSEEKTNQIIKSVYSEFANLFLITSNYIKENQIYNQNYPEMINNKKNNPENKSSKK